MRTRRDFFKAASVATLSSMVVPRNLPAAQTRTTPMEKSFVVVEMAWAQAREPIVENLRKAREQFQRYVRL
ncbi:MAG: hypothetical protein Q7S40_03200 [Opitutaceae bacterium]|nr:hypothetical protein [Opitutaceae bacterium]